MLAPRHKTILRRVYVRDGRPAKNRLPVLFLPDTTDESARVVAFAEWVPRYQPDAVICCDEHVLGWTHRLGIAVPGRLGLVHLNRHPYLKQWAGIDQREDQIGAAAVDLVIEQLVRGETGTPPSQKEVLIKGQWVDGATLRRHARVHTRPGHLE